MRRERLEATALQRNVERLILHPGVAVQWYTRSAPGGIEAEHFLHDVLPSRAIELYAVRGIETEVFRRIATFWGDDLNTFFGSYYADDVPKLFRVLRLARLLRLVPERTIQATAFLTTAEHHVPLNETLSTTLAESAGFPLLIADSATRALLLPLAEQRLALRLLWLPEYIAGR